jgi:DNA-binding transcriptional MocR family regulator
VDLTRLGPEQLAAEAERLLKEYEDLSAQKLALDLTRGKPSPEQLDLSNGLESLPGEGDIRAADGTDVRNYGGGLAGLPELREIYSGFLRVPAAQLMAHDNSSLALMHDTVIHAMMFPLPGGQTRWADTPGGPAFLCPVPGYDRHFAICQKFGIEMIPVPMTPDGPDLDVAERLAAENPRIKGMWCVPKYSNPDGAIYSAETIGRLAALPAAAPDFRLFWDDAYAVHHLTDEAVPSAPILEVCEAADYPDRVFVFGSTSKVTVAGAGVAFLGSSRANLAWLQGHLSKRTIGPDKINQLRHVRFLRDAAGVEALMAAHRRILEPKFAMVDTVLEEGLAGTGVATWTKPRGGYFVSLDVLDGCAAEVVRLAAAAGIALTPAGATFPGGHDPRDRNIRLAPTFPDLDSLEKAMRGVVTCVLLAAVAKLREEPVI